MSNENAKIIKEKVIDTLQKRGPCLPVHVAKETGQSMLFASAFLSELFAERKLKISKMKVGGSPLYFLPEHEHMLENFSEHLKSKEKEAFTILKDKRFLKDTELEPAIRVAIRELKDFAFPFKVGEEIYWRYFTTPQEKFLKPEIKKVEEEIKPIIEIKEPTEIKEKIKSGEKELDIFRKEDIQDIKHKKEKTKIKKTSERKPKKIKSNEKFLEKIKTFLSKDSIEIINIESLRKNEIILRIKENGEEKILVAFDKKKINENEVISAYKKISGTGLKYIIICLGEPSKKLSDLISSIKTLSDIRGLE
ncbi:MAG: hypothetical protein AABX30_00745 [Nanoarchaeota archaeon]